MNTVDQIGIKATETDFEEKVFLNALNCKSYHAFIYPFQWDTGDNDKSFKTMISNVEKATFEIGLHWERVSSLYKADTEGKFGSKYSERAYYKAYQYYNHPARNLILGKDNLALKFVLCNKNNNHVNGKVFIEKDTGITALDILSIKLDMYEFGVGMISYEMVHRETANKEFTPEEILNSVNLINERVRRLFPPYICNPDRTAGHDGLSDKAPAPLTADRIRMVLEGEGMRYEKIQDFSGISNRIKCDNSNGRIEIGETLPEYINDFLSFSNNTKTITDDRMFCCTLVMDDRIAGLLKKYSEGECGNFTEELYKFAFIEESVSCTSASMRKSILRECIYDRWVEYGTIYGVTHHSFVSAMNDISGEDPNHLSYLVENFIKLYVPLVKLVLLQRAGLLVFSERASEWANEINYDHKKGYKNNLEKSDKYQHDYSRFLNEFMLPEVSSQEQAVELYRLLQKQLYIEQIKESLTEQTGNLYEITKSLVAHKEDKSNKRLQILLAIIAIIQLWFSIYQVIYASDCCTPIKGILKSCYFSLLCFVVGIGATVALLKWLFSDSN